MKIVAASHLDHGLSESVVAYIAFRFRDRDRFFIETFELPERLPAAPCGLHGPIVGDAPIAENEVKYEFRGNRAWNTRVCARSPRMTRTVTVIAGPLDSEPCVLYTAYGGPVTPREPGDSSLSPEQYVESATFWAEHALSRGGS